MNINWFLTIPGILITGGVLLLIVALIIFVATSSKKNKNSEIENKSLTEANSMVNSAANTDTSNVNSAGVVPENNSIGSVMTAQQGVSADSFTNIANNMEQPIATPMASNDASQQVVGSDVAQVNDNISTPVADTTVPIQEFQSPISDNTVLGSENVVAPVTNNIPTPVADTAVPVQEFQPPVSNNVVSISQDTDTPVTDNISTPWQ